MFNASITYHSGTLVCDGVALSEIAAQVGTPFYVYSLPRALENLNRVRAAFPGAHIHYSAKANANLSVLRALIEAGAGIDAVSVGEIQRALAAGAAPDDIVFAGVGKSPDELRYAVEHGVGWFNVENVDECRWIAQFARDAGREDIRIAPRLNPQVTANTHPYIATGHGGAKFGLTADDVRALLEDRRAYPRLRFAGMHVHIGSQLHDPDATRTAIAAALALAADYPTLTTLNIGGGFPVAYRPDEPLPPVEEFARAVLPLLQGRDLILEPGRVIIADAGLLVTRVLYVKEQGGERFIIVDASMTELIRPALYQAHHEIIPLHDGAEVGPRRPVNIVGPVCETADVLGRAVMLPPLQPGDLLAVMTAGAYGMVMASNYNARPRPPEVVTDGRTWRIARQRETWETMTQLEQL